MTPENATVADGLEQLYRWKLILPVPLLVFFWLWETWQPFFGVRQGRWRHAVRNIAIALFNTACLALTFGTLTVLTAEWTERNSWGLLNALSLPDWLDFALALILLDGWMHLWHRANHSIPFLWRFHRMHHSDASMDVTTATRFHLGEHIGSATLRLGVIIILGLNVWHIVVYEALVLAVTHFHHADISLGRWDRWLRVAIVTPDMHKVHHSRWRPETNSNYSTVLSNWDRLARSLRLREDVRTLKLGLSEFDAPRWQSFWGMLKTPLASQRPEERPQPSEKAQARERVSASR